MEEKKVRIRWIPIYLDDFFEDVRVMKLTSTDRARWVLLLLLMCRIGGKLPDDNALIASMLGIPLNDTVRFITKLTTLRLLVPSGNELVSPRMQEEYEKAKGKYQIAAQNGSKGGKAKAARND